MNCPRKDVDWFTRHAAGRLSASEAAAFEAHLGECPACRNAAEQHRAVWNALDEWPAVQVSDDFDRRLQARIVAEEAEPWWKRVWPGMSISWKPAISVAAACAAILIIFLLQGPFLERGPMPWTGTQTVQQKVDIDQVESALDDVDMLNQLGGAVPAKPPAHAQSGT